MLKGQVRCQRGDLGAKGDFGSGAKGACERGYHSSRTGDSRDLKPISNDFKGPETYTSIRLNRTRPKAWAESGECGSVHARYRGRG